MKILNKHKNYDDYKFHQMKKTTDPIRRKKWINEEWKIKLNGFKEIFSTKQKHMKDVQDCLCIGARTGQEVVALLELGYKAIGIDLVPFPPYVIEGDMHELSFENNSFDFVFSNVFDHSLYPSRKCSEISRVVKDDGLVLLHFQLGISQDEYTEVFLDDALEVIDMFPEFQVVENQGFPMNFAAMNWEILLKKRGK